MNTKRTIHTTLDRNIMEYVHQVSKERDKHISEILEEALIFHRRYVEIPKRYETIKDLFHDVIDEIIDKKLKEKCEKCLNDKDNI